MNTPLDLETRLETEESAAFAARFDDGVGDLLIGLVILAMGATLGTEMSGMTGIWGAIVVPLWFPLHRAVSDPRLGYVEFGPGRKAKIRRKKMLLSLGLGLTMLGGIAMFMLQDGGAPADGSGRPFAGLPFFGAIALLLTVIGAMLELRRAYAYAGLIMGFGLMTRDAVGIDPLRLTLLLSGACITLTAVWLLIRFIRTHPKLENPELDGGA